MEQKPSLPDPVDHLAAIVRSSDDAIVSKNLDGIITSWNPAAERLFGFTAAEVVGKSITIIIPPERRHEEDEVLRQVRSGRMVDHFESVRQRRDGSLVDVSLTISPIRDAQGRIVGASKIARDITEHRRLLEGERLARRTAEEAVARTARLQELTEALAEALTPAQVAEVILGQALPALGAASGTVAVLDRDGSDLVVAGAIGYPQELIERWRRFPVAANTPCSVVVRTAQPLFIDSLAERMARFPAVGEVDVREPGAVAALPLLVGRQPLGALALVFPDPTGYEEPNRSLLLTIARLCAQALERARLHEAERQGRIDAEIASRAKDEFLAMLGHELRNPLSPILQVADLLRLKGYDDAARSRAIDALERQALHMARLVYDLMDVSRIVHGKIELRKRWLEMGRLVQDAIDSTRLQLDRRGHELTVTLPAQPLWIEADPTRLEQALRNLLDNAAKYTPDGGRIDVSLRLEDREAVLRVRDNGAGIRDDLLERIFDLFDQGETSVARSPGGLGIGLTLTRKLVQLHGGEIDAHSEGPGRGSELVVRLPVPSGGLEPPAEAAIVAAATAALEPLRVLVVEDNADTNAVLAELLRLWGHQVEVLHEGTNAAERASRFRPQAVLLDIGLPGMDGYEVARALRATPETAHARLIALTGYGQAEDLRRSREAGFDVHLTKPVSPAELRRALGDALPAAAPPELSHPPEPSETTQAAG
jgi:PAS domain S-box-containing protein